MSTVDEAAYAHFLWELFHLVAQGHPVLPEWLPVSECSYDSKLALSGGGEEEEELTAAGAGDSWSCAQAGGGETAGRGRGGSAGAGAQEMAGARASGDSDGAGDGSRSGLRNGLRSGRQRMVAKGRRRREAAVKVQCQRLIPYTYHIHMRMRIHIHIVPEAHTAHTMPILCRGMHVCTVCMCEAAVKVHSSLPEAHTGQRTLCPYYAEAPTHDSASAIPAVIIRACIVVAQVQSFARRRQAEQEARARTAAVRTLQARETERHACRRRGEGSRASGGEQLGFGASSARFITESDAALPALSAEEEAAIAKVQAIQRGRIGRRQAADRRARRQAAEAAERHEWEAQQQAAGRKAAAEHDAAAAHAEALRPEAMRTAGLVRGCQAHMMQACILTFAAHAFIATLELN